MMFSSSSFLNEVGQEWWYLAEGWIGWTGHMPGYLFGDEVRRPPTIQVTWPHSAWLNIILKLLLICLIQKVFIVINIIFLVDGPTTGIFLKAGLAGLARLATCPGIYLLMGRPPMGPPYM